jgi:hypothetical protein
MAMAKVRMIMVIRAFTGGGIEASLGQPLSFVGVPVSLILETS